MDTKRNYEIVNGPSKDGLLDAFKYAYTKDVVIPLTFRVGIGYAVPPSNPSVAFVTKEVRKIRINDIAYEDGSGESFNIIGWCEAEIDDVWASHRFEAYYHTKTRKGYIIIN